MYLDVAGDDAETWPEPDPKPVGLVGLFLEYICHKMVRNAKIQDPATIRAETYLMGGGDGTETHPESDPVTVMPTELSLESIHHKIVRKCKL